MKICYKERDFKPGGQMVIVQANEIIEEYLQAGYKLTLRQLYYQFVSRDLIANTTQSYKRLGSIVSDARLAGLIDWDAIEDRTRGLSNISHWDRPSEIVESAAHQFRLDKWVDQDYRVEVWIEKEALSGVIEPVCRELDVPYLSCKGYSSQSEMWVAGQRMEGFIGDGQVSVIIHLGDHDPSGIDMTRDIDDRLSLFTDGGVKVVRIALNMDQVDQYKPPPNPAKMTDSRFSGYVNRYGAESWELDALKPQVLASLIKRHVLKYRDDELWDTQVRREEAYRLSLERAANEYNWEATNEQN